ncbi:MAG: hypothetical protein LBH42_06990, partial [Treponema sp.]|nr:hypothetical protein [Treponema sp.]
MNKSWTFSCIRVLIFALIFIPDLSFAQIREADRETILQVYLQDFTKADLSVKVQILKDANLDNRIYNSVGTLFEFALQFAVQNSEVLTADPGMTELICIAAKGAGNAGHRESVDTLWILFSNYKDSLARIEILLALGKLGKGNGQIIGNLNNYLSAQNQAFKSGIAVDYPAISACIASLAELGDSSSYPSLFSVISIGYPEMIVIEAAGTLDLIPGNYKQFLFDVIIRNPPEEKLAAFRTGMNSTRFLPAEKGQLAEIALEQGLASIGGEENPSLSVLRYAAVSALTPLRWARASP